jgi:hypothetical protein
MLFSYLDEVVSGIVSNILSQFSFIQDLITAPLRAMIAQVLGGVWKGDGANKFVNEMTQEVIPMLASILTGGTSFANNIKKSQDHMAEGFQQASSIAQTLFDSFNNIF